MVDISKYAKDKGKYPSYGEIKSNFGYFLTQIVKDTEIDDAKKEECLDSICEIPSIPTNEFHKKCNEKYFFRNKLRGTSCANPDKLNPFVRANDMDGFIGWISQIIGLSSKNTLTKLGEIIYATEPKIKGMLLNSFLNNSAINSSYSNEVNCLKYFGITKWVAKIPPKLRDAHVSNYNYIHWSFPNPAEDIFKDQPTIEDIACRAGLMGAGKKIIFLHDLTKTNNVRKPTILDAGFYEQFEPGGKTKPLKKCARLSGFDEYVHIPNNFNNLKNNFYEIFNK